MQRQKAEAAEAQSSKLAGQLEKEQADNAKSSAKLKGTEKHVTDVLTQISKVKEMHHLLLQTLGGASDSIQTGAQYRIHAIDYSFHGDSLPQNLALLSKQLRQVDLMHTETISSCKLCS